MRPELLDRVWEERGGRLQLAGDPSRLGRTRAQRVGTAAVLLLAALRWSGQDGGEPVPDAVVRAEVERLGLLDTGNYTKHLAGRRHLLSVSGSGRTATYKLRYDGLEEARAGRAGAPRGLTPQTAPQLARPPVMGRVRWTTAAAP